MKKETDKISVGLRIKQRRTALGFTQSDVSRLMGVSHVAISLWERGDAEPSGAKLHSLADVLTCDPAWLLYGESSAPAPTSNEQGLSQYERELLDLVSQLPATEKDKLIDYIKDKVVFYDNLFMELKDSRKRKGKE
ncbi:TPA: helix-turn-helix domain-containing protein [Yersinia enterocolitica]|uniref:helix-turn-helix domain-containing protein n=1 Tax=Yersinia TaxID=629 RepID=UPI0005E32E64|nr:MULTISPECIES: helix-turn-helix domain-containing protein [Yersinia]EKN3395829.1 helix-turn-helix domain-containing protein [Yersinia enterocolitica]EKN3530776.1 helix-turn-helix domain-containing protein [Yersinia enterocolitica]EKN3634489.1 helix-turn-helix domain-containing protein [Yersinia enterocolitica]EKN3834335.1 helix-turn-helix domain-containing protein [Yersinia enterocolitica]EKN4744989.1 helix-turn-helix domain-containing protein [Yersinia enterocolitica]